MPDTKMLQAIIIDGQKAIKEELKGDIKKVGKDVLRVEEKVDKNGERIDKLGLELAELQDDAPTVDEFEGLERRVGKLEKQTVSI